MFPTQSKAHRFSPLWLMPLIALAMLLVAYLLFAATTAQAQTAAGEYCVEGIVIDWEEKPLGGWEVILDSDLLAEPMTTTSSTDDDDKGEFSFDLESGSAGIYTATIESREGWEGVTPTSITFPINVGEKDCVKIRFKMRYVIPVTVIKIDAGHVGLEDWMIKAVPGKGNLFAEVVEETTNISGTAVFTLTPGNWIFVEHPPTPDKGEPRETYMPVLPPTAQQELELTRDDDAADNITIVFKNELVTGCILIRKIAMTEDEPNGEGFDVAGTQYSGSYAASGWGFKLLRTDGSVARMGYTDARGEVRFDGLPLGPYVLVEEDRPGWSEYTARERDVNVTGNLCDVPIDFYNFQDESGFCIEGYKVDANGGYGIANWEITIEPLNKGGWESDQEYPDGIFTNGIGMYRVDFPRNDYRIPGAKFEVCEEEQDGWLPHTPTCQTVQMPEWPGACVQLKDFVNQQVGHSESLKKSADGMCSAYHTVKPGEGLYDIGKLYKKSAQQMLNANPDVKKSPHQWVYIGQKICVP